MSKPGRNDACPCGSGKKYKHCCQLKETRASRTDSRSEAKNGNPDDQKFQQALAHHQAGQAQDAFILLEQILQSTPDHAPSLNLMGALAMGLGDISLASDLFMRAVQASPDTALYHCNLGKTLYEQKDAEAAIQCFQQALALKADAPTHYDLAVVLNEQGQTEQAVHHYRLALKNKPDYVEAHRGLGILLQRQGRIEEAITCYKKALALQPMYAQAHYSLAHAYHDQGRLPEAIRSYTRAIECKPDYGDAYVNLGRTLAEDGQFDEAARICEMAIRLKPEDVDPYINLGAMYKDMGRYHEAIGFLNHAISLNPASAELHNNLGAILTAQGRLEEAVESYQRAITLKPDIALTWSNLLLALQYLPDISADEVFSWHLRFGQQFESVFKPQWKTYLNTKDPERRLRVGYVSGDFRDHAAAYFFEPVLKLHDKSQIETYCYYTFYLKDAITERYMNLADHWRPCTQMSDDEMAARIREDGIDILVDLSGHTSHNRLSVFARKPAPVQVTWIGYAGTTGLTAMDYRITDIHMDPPGQTERFHTEKLIYLAHSATYQPPAGCPEVNELPALSGNGLVLASLNAPKKINLAVAQLWGRLLAALPGSRLMLGNVSDEEIEQRLLSLFEQAGVRKEQLILQPRMPIQDYLALHHQIDLGLDPFPYAGGTTTMHALWMGVPVVSLQGESTVSRCGSAIMSRVGLADFVTQTEEAYFQRVLALANDLPGLAALRQTLRGRMLNANNDANMLARELEASYRQMWRTWCEAGA